MDSYSKFVEQLDPWDPGLVAYRRVLRQPTNISMAGNYPAVFRRDGYVIVDGYSRRGMKILLLGEILWKVPQPKFWQKLEPPIEDEVFEAFVKHGRESGFSHHKLGAYFKLWLDLKAFDGVSALAKATGLESAEVGHCLSLARLPLNVVETLGNQCEIRAEWIDKIINVMTVQNDQIVAPELAIFESVVDGELQGLLGSIKR